MKYLFLLTVLISMSSLGQSQKVQISGRMQAGEVKKQFTLIRFDNTPLHVPLVQGSQFNLKADSLTAGFYESSLPLLLYLKPGFRLQAKPLGHNQYQFSGPGAPENNYLREARSLFGKFVPATLDGKMKQEAYLLPGQVFLEKIDSFSTAARLVLAKSKDSFFVRLAVLDLDFFVRKALTSYLFNAGMDLKKQEVALANMHKTRPDLTRLLRVTDSVRSTARIRKVSSTELAAVAKRINSPINWNDAQAFCNLPTYREEVNQLLSRNMGWNLPSFKERITKESMALALKKTIDKNLKDSTIRSYLHFENMKDLLRAAKDSALIQQYYSEYKAQNPQPRHLAVIDTIYKHALAVANNRPAPDFSFTDLSGKQHRLSEMKGQYVYIDVWATWCGPCIKEIPEMKKLFADYSGKNIRFVGISVDLPENKATWKKFVKAKQLSGLQLIADKAFQSQFIKAFQVDAIPRFLLISPEGRIVSGDAPRPSEAAIREQLATLNL